MEQYISISALVAEIEKRIVEYKDMKIDSSYYEGMVASLEFFRDEFINTLEVKEVENDRKFECPNTKIKDATEVSSRMKYIDEDLKPIAEFIMDYCSWNLHKDEWNHPVLEVPLFRVLDALIQRGKPYCGKN